MLLIGKWFRNPFVVTAFLAAVVIAAYANTLQNPFVFDDNLNIVDNSQIRDLGRFWPPEGMRWFGYLSFALNYTAGGLDRVWYHATNIAIHAANAVLVFALLRLLFRTPLFSAWSATEEGGRRTSAICFLAAALFAVHPLQTQAVTYIVQRFSSLATMFYLLAVVLYLAARLVRERRGSSVLMIGLYLLGLAAAVLGMKTKEIVITLPVALCLLEFGFFTASSGTGRATRIAFLVPFLLTLGIIPAGLLLPHGSTGGISLQTVPQAFSATSEISRHDYFLTQMSVIMTYLRLLLFPVNQCFDYAYPLSRSMADPAVLVAAAGHLCIIAAAAFLFLRPSPGAPLRRLAGFGILWFYLTLSVESSIVPISDIIFEHRAYLPSVGLLASVSAGIAALSARSGRILEGRKFAAAALCVIGLLASLTALRNTVWHDDLTLWEDVVVKNPLHARGHSMVGIIYNQRGDLDRAIDAFRAAIRVQPDYAEAHVNLGSAYIRKGMLDEGLAELLTGLGFHSLDKIDTAALYINIAYYHILKGTPERAFEYLDLARNLTPEDATVYHFYARAYAAQGRPDRAREYIARAHQLNPEKY